MTRAKDNLFIAQTENNNSVFVNELFGRQNRTKCSESSAYSGQIKTFSNAYTPPVVQQRNISRTVVPSDITFQKAEVSDYTVGSVIKHNNLGIGTIINIMGCIFTSDSLLYIDLDQKQEM